MNVRGKGNNGKMKPKANAYDARNNSMNNNMIFNI